MRSKKYVKPIIVLAILIVGVLLYNFPIFEVQTHNIEKLDNNSIEKSLECVCLLKYQYTTGPGWSVISSTDDALLNENVVISTSFDPRLLKDNESFEMDYSSKIIVVVNEKKTTKFDDEIVNVLCVDDVKIVTSITDKAWYRMKDLSLKGLVKGLLGGLNERFRYSY